MPRTIFTHKCCATCTFWLGTRTPENRDYDGKHTNVECAQKGDCPKLRQLKDWLSTCQYYIKWSAIKD